MTPWMRRELRVGPGGARLAVQGARMVPPTLDPLDPLDRKGGKPPTCSAAFVWGSGGGGWWQGRGQAEQGRVWAPHRGKRRPAELWDAEVTKTPVCWRSREAPRRVPSVLSGAEGTLSVGNQSRWNELHREKQVPRGSGLGPGSMAGGRWSQDGIWAPGALPWDVPAHGRRMGNQAC